MTDEGKLIGWLCMLRLQWEDERPVFFPQVISAALIERGWLTADPEPDFDGHHFAHVTPAGVALTDLHGPDWGISTIPEESNA